MLDVQKLEKTRVLVVGDVMLDRYWHGDVERISPEAPVPVVKIYNQDDRLGGAANVALNIVSVGAKATLMSVVGNDEPSKILQQLFKEKNIEPIILQDDSLQTTVKLRVVSQSQQLLRIDFENQPNHEVLSQLLEEYKNQLKHHDVVLLSDYGKGGLTHIQDMISLASEVGKVTVVDTKGSDFSRYRGATVITPNRSELAAAIGQWKSEADLVKKTTQLRKNLNLKYLLLTRSEDGMTLFSDSTPKTISTVAKEVFDVTGAGDTVIAVLATMLGSGENISDAIVYANRAAGVVVAKFGTATPVLKDLL